MIERKKTEPLHQQEQHKPIRSSLSRLTPRSSLNRKVVLSAAIIILGIGLYASGTIYSPNLVLMEGSYDDDDNAQENGNTMDDNLPVWEQLSQGLIVEEFPEDTCPDHCGCHETKTDCERHYEVVSIARSANMVLSEEQQASLQEYLQGRHQQAQQACTVTDASTTASGGWCLGDQQDKEVHQRNTHLILPNGDQIVTHDYYAAPERIVQETVSLLQDEGAVSLTEFGSGVGQLLVAVIPQLPQHFTYHAFDGAGNVEGKSHGYVHWADMTLPIDAPRSDWVVSFEVAEHVPARYEAMLIRNLHRHNCRGVILSWAALGRGGRQHVNNHSNHYVTAIFQRLGYQPDYERQNRFRQPKGNKPWFQQSVMVFRRKTAVC